MMKNLRYKWVRANLVFDRFLPDDAMSLVRLNGKKTNCWPITRAVHCRGCVFIHNKGKFYGIQLKSPRQVCSI